MSEQHPPAPDPGHPGPTGWAGPPTTPAPPGWAGGAPETVAAGPSARRGWWGEATSTGGGRAALVLAGVLGVLLLVTGLGLATALVVGHDDGRGFGMSSRDDDDRMGPGAMGRGNAYGNGNGNGWRGMGPQQAPGQGAPANPANPRPGMGMGLGRGAAGLGAVLHGEFTTNVTGTPAVMVVQTGQVTAYTAGRSLTVKSTDGYSATYALDAATSSLGNDGATLATGSQVRVLAAKEGMKVVWVGAVD